MVKALAIYGERFNEKPKSVERTVDTKAKQKTSQSKPVVKQTPVKKTK